MANYCDELDAVHKKRYLEKLDLICGIDPYKLSKDECSKKPEDFPVVAYIDIVDYLVYSKSAYTLEELKAYKSLEAFNQFACDWVKDLGVKKIEESFVIVSRVMHSQRLSETPLKTWVVVSVCGSVKAAHCNCMAGLAESCTHVAATLFAVEHLTRGREELAVTEKAAYWQIPSLKSVSFIRVRDADFDTARKKYRKVSLCEYEPTGKPANQPTSSPVPLATRQETLAFLDELHEAETNSAILTLTHPVKNMLAARITLTNLFKEENASKSIAELQEISEALDLSITSEEANQVEEATRQQSGSKQWFTYRAGRVTASRFKSACRTSINSPSFSLIKAVCYPHLTKFTTRATVWGCTYEKVALKYEEIMAVKHQDWKIEKAGLMINPMYPQLAATPDAKIQCSCCGKGFVEVKCPYCLKDKTKEDVAKGSFCLKTVDGKTSLKTDHEYYYQIQAQMHIGRRNFCDFVLWTKKTLFIQRVTANGAFWQAESAMALLFHKLVVCPQLLGKCFSRSEAPTRQPLTQIQPSA